MKSRAAVAFEAGKPLEIVEVDLEGPKAGEVLVEVKATGICHTDEFTLSGADPEGLFPAILGHEGAGVVVDIGRGVTSVKKGDHVIPLYTPECRQCPSCLSRKTNLCTAIRTTQGQGLMPDGTSRFSIGGKPIAQLLLFAREHEPAATDGFFKSRAARRIAQRDTADPVEVVLRSPEGKEKSAKLRPVASATLSWGRSGPIVSEPRPSIWYVDLDRANDKDLDAVMSKLAAAKGVVFDMRGYPNHFSMGMLGHLSDKRLLCARWEIPIANRPDREEMTWDHARWDLPPIQPRFAGKVAFITDGRAISAAETFLGIVEHYKLADIVGEPTAGTNGNVNVIKLPAGYTISFTGMKVLKHDGSRHHGIGIYPTVAVHRTIAGIAAGKDEMLERALEVVSNAAAHVPEKPAE